jgi:hypothetical protein
MINIKRIDTVLIEGTTLEEIQEESKKYISNGYKIVDENLNDQNDHLPYFMYVELDEF